MALFFLLIGKTDNWLLRHSVHHGPVLKDVGVSAHAQNHVICQRRPKCFNAIVLVDVDLPYWTSQVKRIVLYIYIAFTAIFSNICIAHAQKRLFMNSQGKFRHHRSIRRSDFLSECKNLAILRRFPLIFAFYMLNVRHISTSGLFDLLT